MAYPTPAEIDAAVPVDGTPNRALTNAALKAIVGNVATATEYGPVKLGAAAVQTTAPEEATSAFGRTYRVQLAANGGAVVNVPWVNTTYPTVTTTVAGLMSAEDKTKLDGITPQAAPTITVTDPADAVNLQEQLDAIVNALKAAGVFTA